MLLRELHAAWRRLARRPGYAALSIAVLGVGLGVVVFLFSLINTLILTPLPLPHVDRLMAVGELNRGNGSAGDTGIGIGDIDTDQYLRLAASLRGVDATGAYLGVGVSLDTGAGATRMDGVRLTASMLDLMDARPLLGRSLLAMDDQPGASPVVLLGEDLWRHAFGADPHIVGRAVRLDGDWATVVGVLPASFTFIGNHPQLWLPLRLDPAHGTDLYMVARLKAGTTLAVARQELSALDARLRRQLPQWREQQQLVIKPFSTSFVQEDTRHWVWLMFGAGVLVLLLACVNVANLQLVQTLNRRREMAVRSALGCGRTRLMAGALAESLLLCAAALAIALPIAYYGNHWLLATFADSDKAPSAFLRFGIDGGVLGFAVAVALVSTALAGVIPAWRAGRTDLKDALHDGGKGSSGGFARVARALVVAEIALTVVLLVGAGMFVRALDHLLTQPLAGAQHAGQVLTARVALPRATYPDAVARIGFLERAGERLRVDAGVLAATATNTVPGAQLGSHEAIAAEGQPRPAGGWPEAQMGIVDPHFLEVFGVHLLEGRFFDARDVAGSPPVAVVDRKTAAALWPGRDALGRHLVLYPDREFASTVTVVGVTEPLQLDSALEQALPGLLVPLAQSADMTPLQAVGLAVRVRGAAATYSPRLAAVVHGVDAQAAAYALHSQARGAAMDRVYLVVLTEVFSALGVVALLLAAAGLYGVLAFSVAQRTREIGIRRAIGAGHGAVVRAVGGQLLWQLGMGLAIGLALAWPWSNLLADPGLHTRGHDAAVLLPVVVLVAGIALLSSLLPVVRALRVDPAVALRYE
ncbi:ADOP family duplicated permease [Frateuria sp. STR12]|uniref:ADOP family duplicated permease n=1 Tax=Frateuria hangzhouensis TaxID=2995589 RepID=UPI002260A51F|nr:ADOP family duplicated permease [Frateuria sp. STR12]MCX7513967.1 ADOP family duplicated permease [Frateuria sp. STR12]